MKPAALYDRLAATLLDEHRRRGAALTVGITGVDASGKTRFTEALAGRLRGGGAHVQVVHVDDFHRPRAARYAGALPEPLKYLRQSIDLHQLATEVLTPIRTTGRLRRTIRHLDLETDEYCIDRTYEVDEDSIVLVEGVFLLGPPVQALLDRVVFLEVGDEEATRRGIARDHAVHARQAGVKFREKFLPAQRFHLAEHPPARLADLVIDNNQWTDPVPVRWSL